MNDPVSENLLSSSPLDTLTMCFLVSVPHTKEGGGVWSAQRPPALCLVTHYDKRRVEGGGDGHCPADWGRAETEKMLLPAKA